MPKIPNASIGTCPCPVCGSESDLKRFNTRTLDSSRTRYGGRLYVQCREHGALTSNAPAMQEWILDHATVWGPEGQPLPAAKPEAPAAAERAIPERGAFEAPDQPVNKKQHGGWGFFE